MSCAKKGCTDMNSDNYSAEAKKNDNSCVYRYISQTDIVMPYSIYAVEDSKVYIKLFKKSEINKVYTSDIVTTLYKCSFKFNNEFYLTNEDWTMQIWKVDSDSNEENIISADFNPFKIQPIAANNVIKFNTAKNQDFYQVGIFYSLK
jgi:hypothetical protein